MSAGEFEGHEALIAELRAGTLDAPDHLHRRVLVERPSRRQRWAEMSHRRQALVLIPVAATLAVAAAFVHGAAFPSSSPKHSPALPPTHYGPPGAAGARGLRGPTGAKGATGLTGPPGPARQSGHGSVVTASKDHSYKAGAVTGSTGALGGTELNTANTGFPALMDTEKALTFSAQFRAFAPLSIPKNRHVHADAALQVVVPNSAALTRATNKASQIVTGLGGYSQSSQLQAAPKGDGAAVLELRVPVGKTELAIQKLGALGRLVSQQVATQDVEQQYSKQTDTIGRLRRAVAVYKQALQSGTLSGSQYVEVHIRLANAKHELLSARKAHKRTASYAATADIELTLSTNQHAFIAPPGKSGRFGRLLHNAGDFLALEGIIVLYALIVAGPIVLLIGLAWWLPRERRRREEKELLASA